MRQEADAVAELTDAHSALEQIFAALLPVTGTAKSTTVSMAQKAAALLQSDVVVIRALVEAIEAICKVIAKRGLHSGFCAIRGRSEEIYEPIDGSSHVIEHPRKPCDCGLLELDAQVNAALKQGRARL